MFLKNNSSVDYEKEFIKRTTKFNCINYIIIFFKNYFLVLTFLNSVQFSSFIFQWIYTFTCCIQSFKVLHILICNFLLKSQYIKEFFEIMIDTRKFLYICDCISIPRDYFQEEIYVPSLARSNKWRIIYDFFLNFGKILIYLVALWFV